MPTSCREFVWVLSYSKNSSAESYLSNTFMKHLITQIVTHRFNLT